MTGLLVGLGLGLLGGWCLRWAYTKDQLREIRIAVDSLIAKVELERADIRAMKRRMR